MKRKKKEQPQEALPEPRQTPSPPPSRRTINAQETFILAKDIFDARTLIKRLWGNRAVIARRIHILSLIVSVIFTALYAAFVLYTGLSQLSLGWEIGLSLALFVYIALLVALVITVHGEKSTKTAKKNAKALRIFRFALKLFSLGLAVSALVFRAQTGTETAGRAVMDVIMLVASILVIVLQTLGLIFGGLGGIIKWLLSPAKIKMPFNQIVFEWYDLVTSGESNSLSVKRVSLKYKEAIERAIDRYLIPMLGKKKIHKITPSDLYAVLQSTDATDRYVVEGTLKNIFSYALECGYITEDLCKTLDLQGTIETADEPERKKKKSFWGRVAHRALENIFNNKTQE